MKLILLRHGQSEWNLENRFTGWHDIGLTPHGVFEAEFAGNLLIKNDISINTITTSTLKRATNTAKLVAEKIKYNEKRISYQWRLNERHYGALQGLNKSETAKKYGEEQVLIWRRSYDIPPPLMDENDKRHPRFEKKYEKIKNLVPSGESLKDVITRMQPFLDKFMYDFSKGSGNHLIVAHSNSLRAIIKIIDKLSEEEIISINIPTGIPLVYEFEDNFEIFNKKYLIDEKELNIKLEEIANQGKIK